MQSRTGWHLHCTSPAVVVHTNSLIIKLLVSLNFNDTYKSSPSQQHQSNEYSKWKIIQYTPVKKFKDEYNSITKKFLTTVPWNYYFLLLTQFIY